MIKPHRFRWEVLPNGRFGWKLTCDGELRGTFLFQYFAIRQARKDCNAGAAVSLRSELIIKGRNGQIRAKDSYGGDPSEIAG